MAGTRYIARALPEANVRIFLSEELRNVQLSIDSIIALLNALNVPVELGPPDSAGAGYRVLRIPN